jgi:zinc protease
MKVACAICILWTSLMLARPAAAQRINLPPVTRATLPNGTRVVLMEYRRAPAITVAAQFPGGQREDPRDKAGLASLTAELLRKGTARRTAQQIAEEIDFLGGVLSTGADDDRLSASVSVLSKDTVRGLDLLSDILRHPTFPSDELERERELTLAGLQALPEDPGTVASRVTAQVVYARHPYGLAPTITSIKAIQRQDVQRFYDQWVKPNHMILVAVGDFKAPEMLARLRERFADWPKGPAVETHPEKPAGGQRRFVLVDKPDAVQTQARWVRLALPRNHPDYYAAQLAETILGGGFTSRLVDEIRVNRSLTYGISSTFDQELEGGTFGVSTFTKVETTRALITAVGEVLRKTAQNGFTPAELKKGKQYIAGIFAIKVQTPESIAGELADMTFYGLPNDYLETYIQKISAVTLEQINQIARRFFPPDQLSLILVAPARKVSAPLTAVGKFEIKPIESVVR